eukprot:12412560-Karenia_brevis.AAC.1
MGMSQVKRLRLGDQSSWHYSQICVAAGLLIYATREVGLTVQMTFHVCKRDSDFRCLHHDCQLRSQMSMLRSASSVS